MTDVNRENACIRVWVSVKINGSLACKPRVNEIGYESYEEGFTARGYKYIGSSL